MEDGRGKHVRFTKVLILPGFVAWRYQCHARRQIQHQVKVQVQVFIHTMWRIDPKVDWNVGDTLVGTSNTICFCLNLLTYLVKVNILLPFLV